MQGRKQSEQKLLQNQYTRQATVESDTSFKSMQEENNNNVTFKKGWNGREKALLILCFSLFILIIIMIVVQVLVSNNTAANVVKKDNTKVCLTRECIHTSDKILRMIDTTINPCDDFYEYACGGWTKENSIPENTAQWDSFEEVREKRNKIIKNAFKKRENKNKNSILTKLFSFYDACLNARQNDTAALEQLKVIVNNQLGGSTLTDASWNRSSVKLIDMLIKIEELVPRNVYLTKVVPFLDSFVTTDIFNSTQHIIQVTAPELGMYDPAAYSAPTYEKTRIAYRKAMITTGNLLINNMTLSKIYMNDVYDLEKRIASVLPSSTDMRNIKKSKSKITIATLTKETDGKFEWLEYLNKKTVAIGRTMKYDDYIIVSSLKFIKAIVKIMYSTDLRTTSNYMTWTVIQNMRDALPKPFQNAYLKYLQAATGVMIDKPRWEKCIDQSELFIGKALGYLYIKETEAESMRDEAGKILLEIKKAFIKNLELITWMDTQTKEKAVEKAQKMKGNIAFPSFMKDMSVLNNLYKEVDINKADYMNNIIALTKYRQDENFKKLQQPVRREEWLIPPTLVNAFFDPARNKMVFLAGILQSPFYTLNGPKSLNFGSLGYVMGHELTHGFDDQGRLYDGDGDLINWWSNSSTREFQKKSKCVVEQYSNYSLYGIPVNGQLTLGENIADNGGLKTAYDAYQDWSKSHKNDLRLPGLNLTNDQLFFLASSQIWCSLRRKSKMIQSLSYEQHSPGMFRVRGMLSNSRDFARVFNCPKGSTMNPKKKCEVW